MVDKFECYNIVKEWFKDMGLDSIEDADDYIKEMSFVFHLQLKKAWHSGYDEGYKNGSNDIHLRRY